MGISFRFWGQCQMLDVSIISWTSQQCVSIQRCKATKIQTEEERTYLWSLMVNSVKFWYWISELILNGKGSGYVVINKLISDNVEYLDQLDHSYESE